MFSRVRSIIDKLIPGHKRIFLIDGFGAMLTAFLIGVILVNFQPVFGMPTAILYFLSAVACIFMLFSFCCYFFVAENWRPFLRAIAMANITYCCLTIGLVFYFYQRLIFPGLLYFLLETIVTGILIWIELLMLSGNNKRKLF